MALNKAAIWTNQIVNSHHPMSKWNRISPPDPSLLELARVVGDTWEFVTDRGIKYRKVAGPHGQQWFRWGPRKIGRRVIPKPELRFCCSKLKRALGRFIVFSDQVTDGKPGKRRVAISARERPPQEMTKINYCPFCGVALELIQKAKRG
jgi:hypothetical protein